jgi:hypothetical protein
VAFEDRERERMKCRPQRERGRGNLMTLLGAERTVVVVYNNVVLRYGRVAAQCKSESEDLGETGE